MPLLERYRDYLPVTDATPKLSLGEGNTPLIHARRLGTELGCPRLFLKIEGMNPTGSFKDRGMVLTVAKAVERGANHVICASTGNTAASAAAYAAAAGIRCSVLLPSGFVALGKLAQATVYGAMVIQVDANFDEALALVRQASEQGKAELVNSLNPLRLEGQKTAAFEVVDDLSGAPTIVALPVGNAGNISAYWKGFTEYRATGRAQATPEMWGFQAKGAAPLVLGHPVVEPSTIATAIRIGNPARGEDARASVRESGGLIESVSDEEIMDAYRIVGRCEGVMCEPASAAPLAGLMKKARDGYDMGRETIVVVLTGNGLKDPETALSSVSRPRPIPATIDALWLALGASTS